MTILDVLKNAVSSKGFKKYDGEIGLEIETETKKSYDLPEFTYWAVHPDGSLRDFGQEYVLRQPVRYKDQLKPALEEFQEKTKSIKFIQDSVTTSVHVHLNMLNESFLCLGNFFTLYTLFENLLIRYSGPDRLSNLFCLPICDAEETYRNIVTMMSSAQNKNYKGMMFNEGSVKYAACNVSAFHTYGSVEIRSFRGETNTDKIHDWVSILYSLLEYSRRDVTPKEIMLSWKNKKLDFLQEVFGKYRESLRHKDELSLVDQNVWYAGSIAYSVKNWKTLDTVVNTPFKPKQKDLDVYSNNFFGVQFMRLDPAEQDYVVEYLTKEHNKKNSLKMDVEADMMVVEDFGPDVNPAREQNFGREVRLADLEAWVREANFPPIPNQVVERDR